jgi:hypothetical protein
MIGTSPSQKTNRQTKNKTPNKKSLKKMPGAAPGFAQTSDRCGLNRTIDLAASPHRERCA